MAVNISQYRAAIGTFDLNKFNRGKIKCKKKFYHSSTKQNMFNIFFSMCLLLSQAADGHHLPGAGGQQGVHGGGGPRVGVDIMKLRLGKPHIENSVGF